MYTPGVGAILDAGSDTTLSVTFTPQNTTDYTTATANTTIAVTQATPILKVIANGGHFDGAPFSASVTIAGVGSGVDNTPALQLDNITPTLTYYVGSGTSGSSLGPIPPSGLGTYTVVAAFTGDANYSATVSAPVTFTIAQGAATIAVTSTSSSSVYGGPLSFIASVDAVVGTSGGAVTFYDGNTPLATIAVDRSGAATLTTSDLPAGSHAITAAYSGDADFLGVRSATISQTVAPVGTEVVLVPGPASRKRKRRSVHRSSPHLTIEVIPRGPASGAYPSHWPGDS